MIAAKCFLFLSCVRFDNQMNQIVVNMHLFILIKNKHDVF